MADDKLTELLEKLASEAFAESRSWAALPEVTIEALKERAKIYIDAAKGDFPFELGDIVTIRDGTSGNKFAGQPMAVIDIDPDAKPNFTEAEYSSTFFGRRFQVRVLVAVDGRMIPFWEEASELEFYVPKEENADV